MQTSFFVQVKPEYKRSWDPEKLTGLKATKLTQGRPDNVDGFAIKITLDVPDDFFDIPHITINMPSQDLQAAINETKAWTG